MHICMCIYIYTYMYRQIEQKRKGNSISWVSRHENQNTVSSTVACGEQWLKASRRQSEHQSHHIQRPTFTRSSSSVARSWCRWPRKASKHLERTLHDLVDPFGPRMPTHPSIKTYEILSRLSAHVAHTFLTHRESLAWTLASVIFWGTILTMTWTVLPNQTRRNPWNIGSNFWYTTSLPAIFFGQHLWKRVWWLVLATFIFQQSMLYPCWKTAHAVSMHQPRQGKVGAKWQQRNSSILLLSTNQKTYSVHAGHMLPALPWLLHNAGMESQTISHLMTGKGAKGQLVKLFRGHGDQHVSINKLRGRKHQWKPGKGAEPSKQGHIIQPDTDSYGKHWALFQEETWINQLLNSDACETPLGIPLTLAMLMSFPILTTKPKSPDHPSLIQHLTPLPDIAWTLLDAYFGRTLHLH